MGLCRRRAYSGGRFISCVCMKSGGNGVVDDIGNCNGLWVLVLVK